VPSDESKEFFRIHDAATESVDLADAVWPLWHYTPFEEGVESIEYSDSIEGCYSRWFGAPCRPSGAVDALGRRVVWTSEPQAAVVRPAPRSARDDGLLDAGGSFPSIPSFPFALRV
jgi:hypothetical protein